jgi:hypothetical protein
LADAHGSGPCTRKGVGVRVPSSAPASFIFLPFDAFATNHLWCQLNIAVVKYPQAAGMLFPVSGA